MQGTIFNIQRYSLDDGPGMRTTVFVKGCPLSCLWCSNPESQSPLPAVSYRYTSCKGCGTCVKVCPKTAVRLDDDGVHIDRSLCDGCAECVRNCAYKALKLTGEVKTVDEVMKVILRDKIYYETSGGGVTCSGGEILMQPDFVSGIFRRCREEGIHTNADTSGFGTEQAMRKIMEYSDLTYFDLKQLDSAKHKMYTGVDNEPILRNLSVAIEMGVKVVIRVPLIPMYNDDDENIHALAAYVKSLGTGIERVSILPYHSYGSNKYRMIDREYSLNALSELSEDKIQHVRDIIVNYGINCTVSK